MKEESNSEMALNFSTKAIHNGKDGRLAQRAMLATHAHTAFPQFNIERK